MWYSIFHDGNSLQGDPGDVGPISGSYFAGLLLGMFCGDHTKEGIFTASAAYGGFALTGTASPLSLSSGVGICFGRLVVSTEATPIVVASPSGAGRNDRLVLRFSDSGKTVRSAVLTGVEGEGGYPALTQNYATWEVPLWKWTITTGGVITPADERYPVEPRIQVTAAMHEIVEKSIFVPAGGAYDETTDSQIQSAGGVGFLFPDNDRCHGWATCMCPTDLVGGPRIDPVLYCYNTATGDVYQQAMWAGGKLGQLAGLHWGETGKQVLAISPEQRSAGQGIDVGLAETEQGQFWVLDWFRYADEAEDTLNDKLYFAGFKITYQART